MAGYSRSERNCMDTAPNTMMMMLQTIANTGLFKLNSERFIFYCLMLLIFTSISGFRYNIPLIANVSPGLSPDLIKIFSPVLYPVSTFWKLIFEFLIKAIFMTLASGIRQLVL